MKKFLNNKMLLSFGMASVSFLALCNMNFLPVYNPLSWLLYFFLMVTMYNSDLNNKKMKPEIITFSLLFSIILIFGNLVYSLMYDNSISILREFLHFKYMFRILGLFNIFFIVFTFLFPRLIDYQLKSGKSLIRKKSLVFILSFIIIFISWLPYFLAYYPGTLSPDCYGIIKIGVGSLSDLHDKVPILSIFFALIPFKIGQLLFNSNMIGVAFSTVTQMLCLSAIFSSLITFLYNRKVKDSFLFIILLFFAIFPMHGFYSIVMWRDVMFAGFVLLLMMQTIKLLEIEAKEPLSFRKLVPFTICSLLCIFFRHNALYIYILFAIFILIVFRKHYKCFLLVFATVFGVFIFVKGPIFHFFNIKTSASTEYVGIPLQQVGRMAYKNIEFTEKEKRVIEKTIPVEDLATTYNPVIADGIKFSKNYIELGIDNNKWDFLKLYLGLIWKHKSIAIEAYAVSTLGYWYPGVNYWSVEKGLVENPWGIERQSKVSNDVVEFLNKMESRETPILNIEWSIGLCFWIILIFGVLSFKKHGVKGLSPYVIMFGLWATMMIASPVFAEFRYVYSAFVCLPLLMIFPYLEYDKYNLRKITDAKKNK